MSESERERQTERETNGSEERRLPLEGRPIGGTAFGVAVTKAAAAATVAVRGETDRS